MFTFILNKMVYKGRVSIVGMYEGKPFAGFILSSRSEPDRSLRIEENKVWVVPGVSLKEKIAERPFEAVDDLYACLIGFYDVKGNPAAVSFNGRMSNRVRAMMQIGNTAESSLRQLLPVFPPIPGDPRIGAVISIDETGKPSFHFGVYDRTHGPYLAVQEIKPDSSSASYISIDDCKIISEISLDRAVNLDELSLHLFDKILGVPAEFGCGAAVCMIDGKDFRFGLYNQRGKNE